MNRDLDTRRLLVKQMRWEAEDVLSLRLECPEGEALASWQPGAHIDLHLSGSPGLLRQYSLCGDPDDARCYRVAVLRDRQGDRGGSRYVHEELRPGQQVVVTQPRNNFELVESARYLFLAGGIGITPLLPMITEAERRGATWELHYGGRDRASMAFLDELAPYGDRVHLVFGGPLEVDELVRNAADDTLVYACGPAGLLDAVESVSHLLPAGSIKLERFQAAQAKPLRGQDEALEVRCEQSDLTVTVGGDESILEALEKAGVDVVDSCREGVCGTCETGVLRGVPEHRDAVLTADERAAGDTMMICVSRSVTADLVLNI